MYGFFGRWNELFGRELSVVWPLSVCLSLQLRSLFDFGACAWERVLQASDTSSSPRARSKGCAHETIKSACVLRVGNCRHGYVRGSSILFLPRHPRTVSYYMPLCTSQLPTVLRLWLQPAPDGRAFLPFPQRASLLKVLMVLPVQKSHLRESGLGKLVVAMSAHPGETRDNQELSKQARRATGMAWRGKAWLDRLFVRDV